MIEKWNDIYGWEGIYKISSRGKVKSLSRLMVNNKGGLFFSKEKILKPCLTRDGYHLTTLCRDGKSFRFCTHRLVLENFKGLSELQCNHKNGVKTDNRLENLEWVTASENVRHADRTGLRIMPNGNNCSWSKLNQSQVFRLKFIDKHFNVKKGYWIKIKNSLNVTKSLIYQIRKNKIWKHVEV